MLLSSAPHAQNGIFDNGPIVTFSIFALLLVFISLPGLIILAIVLLINRNRNLKDREGKIEKFEFYDVDTLKKYRGNICPICYLKMNKLHKLLECTNCQKVFKITSVY